MTNKETLEKAIHKAIDGGWTRLRQYKPIWFRSYNQEYDYVILEAYDDGVVSSMEFETNSIIFNHAFAKALWAGEPAVRIYSPEAPVVLQPSWMYHLQNMVISEDPIKYLGEHI